MTVPLSIMQAYLKYGAKRTARAMAIGGVVAAGIIGVVGLANMGETMHENTKVPAEWSRDTRYFLREAEDARSAKQRAASYLKAVEAITKKPDGSLVDLHRQKPEFIAAYADILRRLGLAMADSQNYTNEEASEPLIASQTIPFGDKVLQKQAAAALYRLTDDETQLERALDLKENSLKLLQYDGMAVPSHISPSEASPLVELTKFWIRKQKYADALNCAVALHQSLGTQKDTKCVRASVAGLAGQILWKLDHKPEARKWLEQSMTEAVNQGKYIECIRCAALAQELLDRAK